MTGHRAWKVDAARCRYCDLHRDKSSQPSLGVVRDLMTKFHRSGVTFRTRSLSQDFAN